ncbi:synaptogenesis protein syg-2-like isoform X2 [Panulirus ornatus]|uniref:synaptogenesis protein syg-2-like isoform X2 n=1 Tax=Panulirus ornatus TaxID=150431 RepID=UPI003A8A55BC
MAGPPSMLMIAMLLLFHPGLAEEEGEAAAGGGEKQVFRVRPESVQVRAGENVYLCCIVDHQRGKAQWTKDGFALGFDRVVPGYPRYKYVGNLTLGEHHLVIRGATLEDDGEYQCQVGPTATDEAIWAGANVSVMVAPQSIVMVGWGDGAVVEIMEGTKLKLECLVIDAKPAPSVAWYRDNIRLDPAHHKEVLEPSEQPRMWNVRSHLLLRPDANDDGRRYSCRAIHPALIYSPNTLIASASLSVFHAPGRPVISEYQTGEVIRSGESRIIVCHVLGGNPRPWVTWYRHGRPLNHATASAGRRNGTVTSAYQARQMRASGGVFVSQQVMASREEDGAVYECRVSSDLLPRPYTTNVTLTVHYPPARVNITGPAAVATGDLYHLTCTTAPANPPSTITWIVQGTSISSATSKVAEAEDGGWVTSSRLSRRLVRAEGGASETRVECRADNAATLRGVTRSHVINILERPGEPVVEVVEEGEQVVLSGQALTVQCTSTGGNPAPDLTLFKGDQRLEEVELEVEGDLSLARASVRVNASDHGQVIRCEATNLATSSPVTGQTTIRVNYPAWEVKGWVSPKSVEAGQVAKLTCETSSSVPPSTITWLPSTTHALGQPSVKHSPGLYGGTVTRSKVKVRPQPEDNGRVFACVADNGLGVSVSANLTLDVLHGPIWVTAPPRKLDVTEGGDLTITALADANPGPIKYKWQKGLQVLNGVKLKSGEGQLRLRDVHRHMADNYTVTAASVRGAVNASFSVNVQYGPENISVARRVLVEQNETAIILCSASGNPIPNITWVRNAAQTSLTLSSGVGEAHLMVEWATPADTGFYYCYASSSVASAPPVSTAVVVTQAPSSAIASLEEEEASSVSWAVEGGNGLLDCRVKASPQPTFEWVTDDETIVANNKKYAIHLPQLMDGVAEWSSVLEIRGVTKDDLTNYTCTAHNPLGSYTSNYTLSLPTQPITPLTLNVTVVSETSVAVMWTDNTIGAPPSRYAIRYRTTGQRHYELVESLTDNQYLISNLAPPPPSDQLVDVMNVNTSSIVVKGLTPGAEYSFTIHSYDEQGRSYHISPPVVINMSVTEDNGVTEMEKPRGIPFLIFLLIAVMGGALIVLNIVGVLCFLRRRSFFHGFSASSSKTSAYEVPSPVDQLSLSSSDDIPPPDYEQVMGSCRAAVYGGSLQDIIIRTGSRGTPSGSRGTPSGSRGTPSGSRGTPSLTRSSPMVTSSSTISTGGDLDDDIIAPPDDFSNGLLDFSSGDPERRLSSHISHSWADLEDDQEPSTSQPTSQPAFYNLPIAHQPSYRLPRPVGRVSAAAFRSMESLAPLYTQRYQPQPTFTLPRRPSQVIFHGQPHIQQQIEQQQQMELEQEQYQQQLEQQQQQIEQQQQYHYPQLQELSSSVDYQQTPLDEQYFMQQQQCCHPQPPTDPPMSVPPPYASLDPSTLYSLHSTFFDDGSRPSTSYSDWPPMTPTYPTRHFSES